MRNKHQKVTRHWELEISETWTHVTQTKITSFLANKQPCPIILGHHAIFFPFPLCNVEKTTKFGIFCVKRRIFWQPWIGRGPAAYKASGVSRLCGWRCIFSLTSLYIFLGHSLFVSRAVSGFIVSKQTNEVSATYFVFIIYRKCAENWRE